MIKDESSDEDDEDWVNPGGDDCDSNDETIFDTDDDNESDKEAEENAVH